MLEKRDVFIAHASEDKPGYVRPLAHELKRREISYWLDEAEIKWGDRITKRIEDGLRQSDYVIVVLSNNFLGRNWPEAELGAALNRENSYGETIVLPLIVDDAEAILSNYPLLRDKLYLHWDKGLPGIVDSLKALLNPPDQEASASALAQADSSVDQTPEEDTNVSMTTELLSTSIYFSREEDIGFGFSELKRRMFAILVEWIEYEQVEDKHDSLTFPDGTFCWPGSYAPITLTLMSGTLQLDQILAKLGEPYKKIQFNVDRKFHFGDLIRRSRGNVRRIQRVASDELTFLLPNVEAELTIENTEEGSSLAITPPALWNSFKPDRPPIPYTVVLEYLEKDPPADALETAIKEAIGYPEI